MRKALMVYAIVLMAASVANAAGPEFNVDPFDDADFINSPLILEVGHPSEGRGEVGLSFSSSLIDKYSKHLGGTLDFNYNLMDSLGVGASFTFMHGVLTTISVDQEGIIGNKINKCKRDEVANCDATPTVPDFNQITGWLDLTGTWTPLYGKVNLVSEGEVNLEFYVLGGLGWNGTRQAKVTGLMDGEGNGVVEEQGPGAGGFFSKGKPHGTFGLGMKLFFSSWFALRAEFKGLFFQDEFVFDEKPVSYTSTYWFGNVGANFVVF